MSAPTAVPAFTDTPQIAAQRELLKEKVAQLSRMNCHIDVDKLRLEALRHFVADLILAHRVSYEEAELATLTYQVQALGAEVRQRATGHR